MALNVFIDTMVYLHHRPLEELDLCTLLGVDEVHVLVSRVTVRELDRHKNQNSSRKIRERARRVLKSLEGWFASGARPRAGISISHYRPRQLPDLDALALDPGWNDDLLIGDVVAFRAENPEADVVLVSQDSGPRLTAQHLGIRAVELPATTRLVEELDESEQYTRDLERQLERIKNALPNLEVSFEETDSDRATFRLPAPLDDEDDLQAKLEEKRREYPERTKSEKTGSALGLLADIDRALQIPDDEYARYAKEREIYLRGYQRYLEKVRSWRASERRMIRFAIQVANVGTAPADDVDIDIHFPDGFHMYCEDDLPEPPDPPSPPVPPQNALSRMANLGTFDVRPHLISAPNYARELSRSTFRLRRGNSYTVSEHFNRIKHGDTMLLPTLVLVFDSDDTTRSFHCDFEIRLVELPEAVYGRLHFLIEREPGS